MAIRFGKHSWAVFCGAVLLLLTVRSLPLRAETTRPHPAAHSRLSATNARLPDRQSPVRPDCRRAPAPHWQAVCPHPPATFVPLVSSDGTAPPAPSPLVAWATPAVWVARPVFFSLAFRRFLFRCCVAANAP